MQKKFIIRTILSVLSFFANIVFLVCEFSNFFLYMGLVAILMFITGLGGHNFSSFHGIEIGYIIIGVVFIVLFINSIIALFKTKDNSKRISDIFIIRTSFTVILYGIYYIYFMPLKHDYILLLILVNFLEMIYNIYLSRKLIKTEKFH